MNWGVAFLGVCVYPIRCPRTLEKDSSRGLRRISALRKATQAAKVVKRVGEGRCALGKNGPRGRLKGCIMYALWAQIVVSMLLFSPNRSGDCAQTVGRLAQRGDRRAIKEEGASSSGEAGGRGKKWAVRRRALFGGQAWVEQGESGPGRVMTQNAEAGRRPNGAKRYKWW